MTRKPKIPERGSLLNNSMDGMDELFNFQTKEESAAEKQTEKVSGENTLVEMEFAYMSAFPDHKFKLYTGQRLDDMVSSIKEYGILMPVILWHHEGLYIILSGHNRVNAGKIAGLTKCLVIIKENLSYEDAVLIVTETNLRQRSFDDLSPSEKAYCLKQHYEAIKCQGKRNDLLNEIENLLNPSEIKENETLSENQKRLRSDEKLGEEYGLNRDNVAKYLRIATLVSPLLEMLDEKKISMKSAYDLSFVKEEFMQTMIQYPFKFLALSRPVDISPLITEMGDMLKEAEEKRKEILRQEILQMGSYALSGEIVERQFYIAIWDKQDEGSERDMLKKASLLCEKFAAGGVVTDILTKKEIVRLVNLVNNPSYTHLEDAETSASIPTLKGVM